MTFLVILTIVIFVAIVLLILSYIKIDISVKRVVENDEITLNIKALYGLIKRKFTVPAIKFSGLFEGVAVKKQETNSSMTTKDTAQDKIHVGPHKIHLYFKQGRNLLHNVHHLTYWITQTLGLIHCSKFRWITHIGLGDAVETAMTVGVVWGIKSSAAGFIFQYVHLEHRPELVVQPVYNLPHFSTELTCIAKIRFGYAIFAGIMLLLRALKMKGGKKLWQNILSKA